MSQSAGGNPGAVAIVGIGCRFPGGVTDARSYWQLLAEGRDAIGEIPQDRIDLAHYFDPRPATPGRIMTRWGGFLENIELFDAGFFGISPREAERLDPQQRLVLETAWEALEDAGQPVPELAGSRTGIFIGQWLSDFEARLFADPERADFLMTTGSGRYATSGRVSYLLGLQGPSLTVDTACSSSLVAVHLAARSIRDGESDLALAGGVNIILQPHISVAYSQSRMMAPDGRCKFGDASGNGYVRSEGAGIVVLKSLERAVRDGDRIYALIRGGAINNDGRCSGSMGTPARAGQEALLRTAYADAGVAPAQVGYIEAHGTGTRAGDPVELGALGAVLGEGREPGRRVRVGSVKTNFGHTEGAAGVAGLIKLALSLHHRQIPVSLHCRELNPAVSWAELPVEVARAPSAWEGDARIGGVSAFGIAGTNAHIVLQSAPPALAPAPAPAARELQVLPLSARSPEALRALATRFADLIESSGEGALARICGEAAHRRGALEYRAACIAADGASMRATLAQYAAGEPAAAEGLAPAGRPRIAFIVPGQGAQWTGMARALLATEPVFRDAIERCDAAARRHADWSILEQIALDPDSPGYLLNRIDVIQPVLVALAIGYADWLAAQGIRPDAVVGHSMGEVGSAYIAGVLDLDAAMRIICRRSALMREQSGRGAMAMVDLSIADAEARIGDRGERVSVAVSNSPRSSVISGDPEVVGAILAECQRDGVFCRRVNVDVASHSPQMEEAAARLRDELQGLATSADRVALYSTVLARRAAGDEFGAGYWASNLRRPVRFADAITAMLADGITVFVELGPHPVLLPAVQQTAQAAGGASIATIGCGRREEPEQRNLLATAAAAWAAGVEVDWHALQPRIAAIELPRYPWQRERHWVREAEPGAAGAFRQHRGGGAADEAAHPLLDAGAELAGAMPGRTWQVDLEPHRNADVAQHRLFDVAVAPASLYLELGFAAARSLGTQQALALGNIAFERPLYLDAEDARQLQMQLLPGEGPAREVAWFSQSASQPGWVRHAHATVGADAAAGSGATVAPLEEDSAPVSGQDFYEGLAARGASFGPELSSVTRAWRSSRGCEAELAPAAPEQYRRRILSPAVLDACFQVASWSMQEEGLWLPASLEAALLQRAPRGAVRIRLRRTGFQEGSAARCDLQASDQEGVFLSLWGIALRRLGSATVDPSAWQYQVRWRHVPETGQAAAARNAWAIVEDGSDAVTELADALAGRIGQSGEPCLRLSATRATEAQLRSGLAEATSSQAQQLQVIDLRPCAIAGPEAAAAIPGLLHGVVELARGVQSAGAAHLALVTRAACAVDATELDDLQPLLSSCWGLGASLAAECGDIWSGCIDLGKGLPAAAAADAILARLRSGRSSDVAIRSSGCHERTLERLENAAPASVPAGFRPDATYLVTGGLGEVGAHITRWMVAQGARRLLVLGRRALPHRRQWATLADPAALQMVRHVRALEAMGASVHYQAVDVGDFTALQSALRGYAAEGWPAIRGVVHMAGAADDRLALRMEPQQWAGVLSAKALGACHLHALLPDLDLFLLFSSMAALLPEPGQASYAAANAVLDSLAQLRRARGANALSIGWGIWSGVGMMGGESGQQKLRQIEERGVHGFSPPQGLQALEIALRCAHAHLLVMPVDWQVYAAARGGRIPAIVGDLAQAPAAPQSSALEGLDPAAMRQRLEHGVRAAIARVLKIPAERIDPRKPLGSMGLGSLLAMELRNLLEALVARPLSATLLWNYPTVEALVAHLAGADAAQAAAATAATAPGTAAPVETADVDALSDDEAAMLLMRRGRARS